MKYAVVMAVATSAADDATAITFAANLAKRYGGLARVAMAFAAPAADGVAWAGMSGLYINAESTTALVKLEDEMKARIVASAERAAKACGLAFGPGEGGSRLELENESASPWLALTSSLPLVDLTIIGPLAAKDAALSTGPLADALMEARAPVLVAHSDMPPSRGTVAIAWDGSLEAARAVRAARPFLQDAEQVVILQDRLGVVEAKRDAADPTRLTQYLHLHGIAAVTTVDVRLGRNGRPLLDAARSQGAGLLVAGAYGHSRVREWAFGGATRAMLEAADGPCLLLAH